MGEDQSQTGRRRLTVAEASEFLGITVEAVRGRIKRKTLEHERDSGTVYVLLDADQSHDQPRPDDDQTSARPRPDDHTDITEELRDRISYLERQVEEEREARRRADTILAQLSAANAEQARTIRALEAPQEASEDAETVEEAQDELGAERARRETAETMLHDGMAEERRRREEAERERDELRRQLYARREPRESPESPEPSDTPTEGSRSTETPVEHPEGEEVWLDAEGREAQPQEATESPQTAEEAPERAEPRSATGGAREGAQRPRGPWWRRILGR